MSCMFFTFESKQQYVIYLIHILVFIGSQEFFFSMLQVHAFCKKKKSNFAMMNTIYLHQSYIFSIQKDPTCKYLNI